MAALLKEWKDRSGYSYGVLAKRLHMSTSTLHRYCNGDAVPTEYAPLERLARLCRATPDELVELHRRWILADEARRRERDRRQGGGNAPVVERGGEGIVGSGANSEAEAGSKSGPGCGSKSETEADAAGTEPEGVPPTVPVAALAGSAFASGSGRVTSIIPEGGPCARRRTRAAGSVSRWSPGQWWPPWPRPPRWSPDWSPVAATAVGRKPGRPRGRSAAASRRRPGRPVGVCETARRGCRESSPSSSPSPSRTFEGKAGEAGDGVPGPGAADRAGLPVSVDVRPYSWEDPCSQRYLVDRDPGEMPPPPTEQDARGWISALGAVSADSQRVQVSVQGAGDATVVVHALRVRVVGSSAPPAWDAYSMGVGCGGGITPKSFGVALDAARPQITPQNGQRDFPYKASERDPEVFTILARAGARDVRWYMELEWSSGNRHGTLRIDDNGEPFRTSGMAGRPQYDYPLGGSNKWVPAPKENG
ncbi:helix-turn-helix domain-containing protein [Streptomyces lydicus]|nr:helix-turn-helix domain-containing protein [Streptomyces lydicus]